MRNEKKFNLTVENSGLAADGAYLFLIWYLMLEIVMIHLMPGSILQTVSPYILFGSELLIVFLFLRQSNWTLKIGDEAAISAIILITVMVFTCLHAGPVSMIVAVAKEFAIFFMCVFFTNDHCSLNAYLRILRMAVGFGLIALAYALIHDRALSIIIHMQNAYSTEIMSFWGGKNAFGRFLYIATVCAFTMHIARKEGYTDGFCGTLVCTAVLALGLVFTFSRTPLLSICVFFTSYYFLTNKTNRTRNLLLAAAALLVLIFMFTNDAIVGYLDRFILRKSAGLAGREDIWEVGLSYIRRHPIIGAGEYMAEEIIHRGGIDISEFHNAYIYRCVASGIPVFLLYVYLWVKMLRRLYACRSRNVFANCSISLGYSVLAYMMLEQYSFYHISLEGVLIAIFMYCVPFMEFDEGEGGEYV